MSDQFLGEIRIFTGNFAPQGWALCNGQLLSIAQNTALFSLLGVSYGGDGRTTFGLPNLRGQAPMSFGDGPGLTPRILGETGGSSTVTLTIGEMPQHNHVFVVDPAAKKELSTVSNNVPAGNSMNLYATAAPNVDMAPLTLAVVGGSIPHDNMQPYVAVNFCIALIGIFPARG